MDNSADVGACIGSHFHSTKIDGEHTLKDGEQTIKQLLEYYTLNDE